MRRARIPARAPLVATIAMLMIAGCSDSTGPARRTPADVRIASELTILGVGDAVTLEASVLDAEGGIVRGVPVTWSALGTKVTLDAATGAMTAVDTGEVRVVARAGTLADTATVRVTRRVASLEIVLAGDSVFVQGATVPARAVARDGKGVEIPDAPIRWSIDGDSAVSVTRDGSLAASAPGTATLRAESGAIVATKPVRALYRRLLLGFIPTAVQVGHGFGCALDPQGRAHCWGDDKIEGLLGRTAGYDPPGIAPVAGDQRFARLEVDNNTACGITAEGRLFCWGRRAGIETVLPNGTRNGNSQVPAAVIDSVPMRSVHIGSEGANCSLGLDGIPRCWGRLDYWQGGEYPTEVNYRTPVPLQGDLRFQAMHVGFHATCGLPSDGVPWCWGDMRGWLGGGQPFGVPFRVDDAPPMVELGFLLGTGGGTPSACGRTADGSAWCWGAAWNTGVAALIRPTRVTGIPPLRSLTTGVMRACGIATDGAAWCWDATLASMAAPRQWAAPHRFDSIDVGGWFSSWSICGITTEDEVICTGPVPSP